jgi:hypothetical protein
MMRKSIAVAGAVLILAAAFQASALAANGRASKAGKKVSDSFSVQLAPFPKLAAWGDVAGIKEPGCLSGQENVNWQSHAFKAPANGVLTASLKGFTGDWDLYILNSAKDRVTPLARSENDQVSAGAAAEEEAVYPVKKAQTYNITPCNWAGQPNMTVNFIFAPGK